MSAPVGDLTHKALSYGVGQAAKPPVIEIYTRNTFTIKNAGISAVWGPAQELHDGYCDLGAVV